VKDTLLGTIQWRGRKLELYLHEVPDPGEFNDVIFSACIDNMVQRYGADLEEAIVRTLNAYNEIIERRAGVR